MDTEARWQEMFLTFNPRYQTGAFSSAVSAVDIALWDIKGKHLNQPVWRLLGGAKKTVPAYITFGLLQFDRDQLVEFARQFLADGQDKFKMVVAIDNGENVAEDAARVGAVREAIGPDRDLMIDGNYLFSMNRALQLAKHVEPYNLTWFEEPIYGNDARLLAQLRQRCSVPISAGQNEGFRYRHLELLQHDAVDILQSNVVYVGGYTEGMKVAALAQAYNINIADGGGWPHHNMHLQAAASNGWRVEFHYLMWMTGNTIYRNPPQPVKGNVTLTDDPGLGLEPNREALQEYSGKLSDPHHPLHGLRNCTCGPLRLRVFRVTWVNLCSMAVGASMPRLGSAKSSSIPSRQRRQRFCRMRVPAFLYLTFPAAFSSTTFDSTAVSTVSAGARRTRCRRKTARRGGA